MTTTNNGTLDPEATKAPSRPGLDAGTIVGDRYEIVRLIGEGGMGAVYEARHRILGRLVAIKVLKPEVVHNEGLVARFLQEAKAAAELHHKNIVELNDYGVDGDRPYMVMELLQGEDLGHLLKREGTLPVPRLVTIIDPILRALAMAHERGVIHRDIKPENIFLVDDDGEQTPKLVDFGIAKRQEENVQLTSANMALGTPAYMAPEQIMSSRTVTGAADQYAVGVTLYEALTARNPYDADTLNAFIVAKATQDPEPLMGLRPDLDPRFAAIVMKTLSRKPDDRYPTIAALREALAPFRGTPSLRPPGGEASHPPISKPAPAIATAKTASAIDVSQAVTPSSMVVPVHPPTERPRSSLGLALGGVALAVVVGVGAFVTLGSHHPRTEPQVVEHPATADVPAPRQQEVLFAIEVEPRSALIRLDGEIIGTGRAEIMHARDGSRHQLAIDADGYASVNDVLVADADVRVERQLTRTAVAPPNGTGTNNPVAPVARRGTHTPPVVAPQAPTVVVPPPVHPPPETTHPPVQPPTEPAHPRDTAHPSVDPTNPFDEHH